MSFISAKCQQTFSSLPSPPILLLPQLLFFAEKTKNRFSKSSNHLHCDWNLLIQGRVYKSSPFVSFFLGEIIIFRTHFNSISINTRFRKTRVFDFYFSKSAESIFSPSSILVFLCMRSVNNGDWRWNPERKSNHRLRRCHRSTVDGIRETATTIPVTTNSTELLSAERFSISRQQSSVLVSWLCLRRWRSSDLFPESQWSFWWLS